MAKRTRIPCTPYPALCCSSDDAAQRYRQLSLWIHRVHLGSLAIGGLAGAIALSGGGSFASWIYAIVAACLFFGFLLLWVSRAMGYEGLWFDCRAVAESVKTAAWRYMTKAPPFENDDHVRTRFVAELKKIREARPEASKRLAGKLDASTAEITAEMTNMRDAPLQERTASYMEKRVHNQRLWYTARSNLHANAATFWFWIVFALQALAVVVAVIIAVNGRQPFDIISILTTLAAVGVAWDRGRRNTELSRAYSFAAQELSALESVIGEIQNEEEFSQYVEQVEEAISREHTLWYTRRDLPQGT